MARARNTRLARITADEDRAKSVAGLDRGAVGAWATVCVFVRDRLERAGINPANVRALHLVPHPASRTRALVDGRSGALPASVAGVSVNEFTVADSDSLAAAFAEKLGQIARRYEDGHAPDFANASLAELLAWCLAGDAER